MVPNSMIDEPAQCFSVEFRVKGPIFLERDDMVMSMTPRIFRVFGVGTADGEPSVT